MAKIPGDLPAAARAAATENLLAPRVQEHPQKLNSTEVLLDQTAAKYGDKTASTSTTSGSRTSSSRPA